MAHQSELIEKDIIGYLKSHEHKSLLRFITCGSVDDGKSTLIGRLLYESKLIYEDQLSSLEKDSKKVGTQGDQIDFALLVDGLAAEREQGITIDVAYRYFSTDKRKFIVADTPGHEQYTRNMATGASSADLAILMIDARYGVVTQTRRHSKIVHLLGVKKVVLAINKMDLVNYSQDRFEEILRDYSVFAKEIGITDFTAIPVSALKGDNITDKSLNMGWYSGETLINYLETVTISKSETKENFTMPIQWVNRPNLDFRGFAGQITTGQISVGDSITVLPANVSSKVKSIVLFEDKLNSAQQGQSITITLEDEIDASRGDIFVSSSAAADIGHEFDTTLLWMSEDPLVVGKSYWVKTRAKLMSVTISKPTYKLNINTLEHEAANELSLNEIGECGCEFDQDIAFQPYIKNPHLGSFIIIDRQTNNTVAMGLIEKSRSKENWAKKHVALRDKYWNKGYIDVADRSKRFNHKPLLVVVTGNVERKSYSAAETILEKALFNENINVYRYGFQYLRAASEGHVTVEELRQDMFKKLLEMGFAFLDAGMVFITAVRGLTQREATQLKTIVKPFDVCVVNLENHTDYTDIVWKEEFGVDEAVLKHMLNKIN